MSGVPAASQRSSGCQERFFTTGPDQAIQPSSTGVACKSTEPPYPCSITGVSCTPAKVTPVSFSCPPASTRIVAPGSHTSSGLASSPPMERVPMLRQPPASTTTVPEMRTVSAPG